MPEAENIKMQLSKLILDKPSKLVKALNLCGPELGLWGVNGLTDSRLRRVAVIPSNFASKSNI